MNIEISNEQIEKLLEKQISERVRTWFQQDEQMLYEAESEDEE